MGLENIIPGNQRVANINIWPVRISTAIDTKAVETHKTMNSASINPVLHWFKELITSPLTLRRARGKVQLFPRRAKPKKWSANQKENRNKFRLASEYAERVIANDAIKQLYAQRINRRKFSAYMVAFTDFLTPPRIDEIRLDFYRGRVEDIITIHAHDDFEVTKVWVTITRADGALIEEGDAIAEYDRAPRWHYSAQVANPRPGGCVVRATAYDRPGNTGMKEVRLMDW